MHRANRHCSDNFEGLPRPQGGFFGHAHLG